MKHITAIVVSASPLLSAGIGAALGSMRDPAVTAVEASRATLAAELARLKASAVIADPLLVGPDAVAAMRGESGWAPSFIALHTGAIPREVEEAFDDAVSIYDPADRLRAAIARSARHPAQAESSRELSPREKEIVKGIVKGLSNKEIASEICISVNTVMTHRRNIAAKLDIHSPAGLTIYALMSKLVKMEDIAP